MPKSDREAAAAVAKRIKDSNPQLSQQQARELVNKMLPRAANKKR